MDSVPLLPLAALLLCYLPPAVLLAHVDGREHRLPNAWVGIITLSTTIGLGLCTLLEPQLRPDLRSGLILALAAGCAAVVLALAAPSLLGMGDAKTLPVVVLASTALGGEVLIGAVFGMMLLAGAAGAAVIVRSGRRDARFALGPVLLCGPFLGVIGSPAVRAALGG